MPVVTAIVSEVSPGSIVDNPQVDAALNDLIVNTMSTGEPLTEANNGLAPADGAGAFLVRVPDSTAGAFENEIKNSPLGESVNFSWISETQTAESPGGAPAIQTYSPPATQTGGGGQGAEGGAAVTDTGQGGLDSIFGRVPKWAWTVSAFVLGAGLVFLFFAGRDKRSEEGLKNSTA